MTFLNNKCKLRTSEYIKLYIEEEKYQYLLRAQTIKNPFYMAFFEQCIESTVADAYEVFLETGTQYNYFKEHIREIDKNCGVRFFKLMAIHNCIKITRKKRNDINWNDMKKYMLFVYDFDALEEKLSEILYQSACAYETEFSDLFAKTTARYLFLSSFLTPFSLAFIENFCYNSYSNFMATFTRYYSIRLRLKKVAK